MLDNIKTCFFGGYDKIYTLHYIESLTNEIELLEEAYENKINGHDYKIPEKTPRVILKSSIIGGYNKKDVDDYISELIIHIKNIRRKF